MALFVGGDDDVVRRVGEPRLAEAMQKLEADIGGFGYAAGSHQTEAAVEWSFRPGPCSSKTSLKVQKDIMAVRPSHSRMVLARAGPNVGGVEKLQIAGAHIEFADDERKVGALRVQNLVVHLLGSAPDHIFEGDGFFRIRAEDLCGLFTAIDVAGDEVERNIVRNGMGDQVADPGSLRGRVVRLREGAG